ncbi:methyl-accepting chemotaxis protein [Roseburia sp. CLA-AA-H204]|nr:methyl-accepting chemotaxis protein [Roseburia sp. CLA-AA-H209]MCC2240712.1 methyl-accepting chemotaxis protein [Roseburia amylophila]MCI6782447.1 methyl-accepting chemotaxis protein [Lachnospiraceae bacterium]
MDEEKKNSDIHENVQKTSEYIQKINDITKQLDKIEKNQKILALNASIEAARAGEAGKGFAIVATNVSALATDFGNNNREIKDELQKLNEVIAAIEKCE